MAFNDGGLASYWPYVSAGLLLALAGIAADCQAPNRPPARLPLLTTTRQAHTLTYEQASRAYPVHLRGVVTFYDPYQEGNPALFIADASGSILLVCHMAQSCRCRRVPLWKSPVSPIQVVLLRSSFIPRHAS